MNEIGDVKPLEHLGDGRGSRRAPAAEEHAHDVGLTLGSAMGLFGFALGELSGFSVMAGISQLLLSSVLTFVGGVLLSYAGFRRSLRGRSDDARPDPVRVGVALGCFSLGLCLGGPSGVYMRCNSRVQAWFLGEAEVGVSTCARQDPKTESLAIARLRVEGDPAPDEPAPDEGPPRAVEPGHALAPQGTTSRGLGLQSRASERCDRAFKALNLAVHADSIDGNQVSTLASELRATCGLER